MEEIYEYDASINGFVDKASGQVAAIERNIFVRKAMLMSLNVLLIALIIVVFILKII